MIMAPVHRVAIGIVLLTGAAFRPQPSQSVAPPTRREIAEAIGTDADAGAVLRVVLAHAMTQSHREFFLASQIADEWSGRLSRANVVLLSETDAVQHLAACGSYWVVERVQRTADTVSLWLTNRCGGSTLHYLVSFDGHEWKLGPPARGGGGWVPGIGSGIAGHLAECPCLGRF
jgi:hypothetical protein